MDHLLLSSTTTKTTKLIRETASDYGNISFARKEVVSSKEWKSGMGKREKGRDRGNERERERGWWVGLETRVYRLLDFAELTLDLATPVKRAGASLDDGHLLRFVASAAAHQVAAVDTDTRVVALSTVGAENAEFRVLLAERG